jgi:threonine/homoserine/homoserine lactone efflux protein
MGVAMLRSLSAAESTDMKIIKAGPVMTGVILSVGHPYFFVWWATVGLALATTATTFGVWAFVLFAMVHWSCDFIWLSILSWASFKGAILLGPGVQRIMLLICALALLAFGILFLGGKLPLLITAIHNRFFGGP